MSLVYINMDVKVSFELLGYPNWTPKVKNEFDNESNASIATRKSADSQEKQLVENDH